MHNFFYTLATVYKNRYRQLTHKDSSAFWLPFIVYLLVMFKMVGGSLAVYQEYDIRPYIIIYFSLLFSRFLGQRNDWYLLCSLYKAKVIYALYFIDLYIINSLNIFATLYIGYYSWSIIILGFVIFFTFNNKESIINRPIFKIPFRILDISTIMIFRRYKLNYILFILIYYFSYQGLKEENKNLFLVCIFSILMILLENQKKNEKLIFFISSKLSNKQYIIKSELDFMINSIILSLPSIFLSVIFDPNYTLIGVTSLMLIPLIFPIKYIFFNQVIPVLITSLIVLIIFSSVIFSDKIDWIAYVAVVVLSIIFHMLSFRRFTKEKIIKNSDFYLND